MKEKCLKYHKKGKIGTAITKKFEGAEDLSIAYTPGVAIPSLEIAKEPNKAYDYTNKGNSVAVITNGTAVLGLGNIGVLGAKPVMEGKAMLFKHFADIDAVDVLVDERNPKKFVEVVKSISKTYGGINLEDIKAPECFEIEKELKKITNIPIFHDDQHGTAIVSSASLLNALEIVGKKIKDIKIVFSGAGAAGVACAKLFFEFGVKKENLIMVDSKGIISKEREIDEYRKEFASEKKGNLKDAIKGSDVFMGVSVKDVLTPEMLSSMKKDPIVFALANPDPEINYELAKKTREDVIIATGRSDLPNQVNNVLAFPFVFRGALDVEAKHITEKMKMAASKALAQVARENKKFGKDYIIPEPFEKKVAVQVSLAVAKAALKEGVARKKIGLEEYEKNLRERFGI